MAMELLQDIDRKSRGGNIVIKMDLTKAYDRIEWAFLFKVMKDFGFCNNFICMIQRCITNCWYTTSFMGGTDGYYHSTRGLRQGDPLSPALFAIAQEVWSRYLDHLHINGDLVCIITSPT